jgi:catechol 2,3-dioxygenase-like lactoylglutathione lyase family enzyme
MRFRHVQLAADQDRLDPQRAFYAQLGLAARRTSLGVSVTIGETELEFVPGPGAPFYHFALLVPGDRFNAARDWIADQTTLLPHADNPDVVFEFPAWDARACYFHDPAGNIVELIAHRDLERTGATGAFSSGELRGLSELGLPGRPTAMAPILTERLGLEVWDGRVADEDALAFVGVQARTLILVPVGRGWLPTGRPSERYPATVRLEGAPAAEASLGDGLYRVSVRPPARVPRG